MNNLFIIKPRIWLDIFIYQCTTLFSAKFASSFLSG